MNEWMKQFVLKAIYGAVATVAAGLLAAVSQYDFKGNSISEWIWGTVIVGGLTGLVAVLKRVAFPYKG